MLGTSLTRSTVLVLKHGTDTQYFRPRGRNGQVLSKCVLVIRTGDKSTLQYSRAKGSSVAIEQYKDLLARAVAKDDGPQWDSFQLVTIDVNSIDGLTPDENRVLEGVLKPSSTIGNRTMPTWRTPDSSTLFSRHY